MAILIFGRCDCATAATHGCESELTITASSQCSDRGAAALAHVRGARQSGHRSEQERRLCLPWRFRRSKNAPTEALLACLPAFSVRACDRRLRWPPGLALCV